MSQTKSQTELRQILEKLITLLPIKELQLRFSIITDKPVETPLLVLTYRDEFEFFIDFTERADSLVVSMSNWNMPDLSFPLSDPECFKKIVDATIEFIKSRIYEIIGPYGEDLKILKSLEKRDGPTRGTEGRGVGGARETF